MSLTIHLNRRCSKPAVFAALFAARRSSLALRPFGRRGARMIVSGAKGCRWPHDPQRNDFAARSAVAAVTLPVWPHLAQRTGQLFGSGDSMAVTLRLTRYGVTALRRYVMPVTSRPKLVALGGRSPIALGRLTFEKVGGLGLGNCFN